MNAAANSSFFETTLIAKQIEPSESLRSAKLGCTKTDRLNSEIPSVSVPKKRQPQHSQATPTSKQESRIYKILKEQESGQRKKEDKKGKVREREREFARRFRGSQNAELFSHKIC